MSTHHRKILFILLLSLGNWGVFSAIFNANLNFLVQGYLYILAMQGIGVGLFWLCYRPRLKPFPSAASPRSAQRHLHPQD